MNSRLKQVLEMRPSWAIGGWLVAASVVLWSCSIGCATARPQHRMRSIAIGEVTPRQGDEPDLSSLKPLNGYTLVIYPNERGYYVALVNATEFTVRRLGPSPVPPTQPARSTLPLERAGKSVKPAERQQLSPRVLGGGASAATTQGGGGGTSQIEIADGWVYVVGTAPVVGTETVIAGSDGTRLIVEKANNRIVGLYSAGTISGSGNTANGHTAPATPLSSLPSYMDGLINLSGKIDHFGPQSANMTPIDALMNDVRDKASKSGMPPP